MKRLRRQERILSRLRALQKELSVDELARLYGVSDLTIRRDLDQLERDGMVIRTHGGCLLKTSVESSYHRRAALNFELKEAIGREAVREIESARTLLVNDGSTTFHMAVHLRGNRGLSVYTNSIAMMRELIRFPEIELYVLGGRFDRRNFLLGGSLTELLLESLSFDAVFLGADAIDAQGGCLVPTPAEARLTRSMLKRGKRKILLADHTKCRANSYVRFASLSDFDLWITTPGIPTDVIPHFKQLVAIKEVSDGV
jgi:DeoR/GlpR family transcriptional regulator of sugar metabolism